MVLILPDSGIKYYFVANGGQYGISGNTGDSYEIVML
jgi:hypothetical protein